MKRSASDLALEDFVRNCRKTTMTSTTSAKHLLALPDDDMIIIVDPPPTATTAIHLSNFNDQVKSSFSQYI